MASVDEEYFRKIVVLVILAALLVLSFFLLKPILLAIIVALILAYMFSPIYDWLVKHIHSKNLSATIILIVLLLLIILPIWFLTPILIQQSFKIFETTQQIDFITPLKQIFPSFFASAQFSSEVGSIISSFTSRVANLLVNSLSDIILNFPTISLELLVVFFTFFFVLRDKQELIGYLKSISPFSKDMEKKLFLSSKGITSSVIYGQAAIGFIQGIVLGIGLFLFGAPNALLLTLFSVVAGIIPIVGTVIVWLPVMIYFLIGGNNVAALGILFFGLLSSTVDHFLRPLFVSKWTDINTAVVIIGMIGGVFMFGILGFILGPLILAYLLIILEVYRKRKD